MKTDTFHPIRGHFRDHVFLLAALKTYLLIHVPSASEILIELWTTREEKLHLQI